MADDRLIGQFQRVRIEVDGPDVILTLPKNPSRAHWTDFAQIEQGLLIAIKNCRDWEAKQKGNGGRKN